MMLTQKENLAHLHELIGKKTKAEAIGLQKKDKVRFFAMLLFLLAINTCSYTVLADINMVVVIQFLFVSFTIFILHSILGGFDVHEWIRDDKSRKLLDIFDERPELRPVHEKIKSIGRKLCKFEYDAICKYDENLKNIEKKECDRADSSKLYGTSEI